MSVPLQSHIDSNLYNYVQDVCTAFSEPLIHTFVKNASVIDHDLPFFKSLRERTNVILLGDSFGGNNRTFFCSTSDETLDLDSSDLQMDVGVEREGVALKIGFLNFNVDQLMDKYKQGFDVRLNRAFGATTISLSDRPSRRPDDGGPVDCVQPRA